MCYNIDNLIKIVAREVFMKSDKINKLKMIKIWEILSQETDENHPMTTNELLSKLEALGIDCNRKTLYADIDALNEFG